MFAANLWCTVSISSSSLLNVLIITLAESYSQFRADHKKAKGAFHSVICSNESTLISHMNGKYAM